MSKTEDQKSKAFGFGRLWTLDLGLWTVLAVAAVFYALLLPRYPIGYAIDDALYIRAAQSLLQGRYVNLSMPGEPALTDPLPGFPALLVPFVAVVQPRWSFLKVVPWVLTLVSVFLFWRLARPWMSSEMALAATALFALSPTTANFSGIVVSEPAFVAIALSLFLLLRSILKKHADSVAAVLGLLLGLAALTRPQGAVLFVALAAALIMAKRWRALGISAGLGILLWAGVLVRNTRVSGHSTGYAAHWAATLPALFVHPGLYALNAWLVLRTFIFENGFAVNGELPPAAIVLGLIPVMLCLSGLFLRKQFKGLPERNLQIAWALFGALYLAIHLFWLAVDSHYLYPILPVAISLCMLGLSGLMGTRTIARRLAAIAFAVVIGRYLYCDAWAIPAKSRPGAQLPLSTYAWIEKNLPSDALVFSPAAPTVNLYTGRKAIYAMPPPDPDALRFQLSQLKVDYLIAQPIELQSFSQYHGSSIGVNERWRAVERWTSGWTEVFQPVYQDSAEGTVVYAVRSNPSYPEAYRLYRQALEDFAQSHSAEGQAKLRRALKLAPDLAGAWNAMAASLLLSGGDLREAEKAARQAIQLRPNEPLFQANLSRILLARH